VSDGAQVQVSVVVPAHDAAATLPATLAALEAQEIEAPFEVIVVDDGSKDRTAQLAERAGVRVVRNRRPLGPGAARNAGVAASTGSALAFTDADCVPTRGWLAAGVEALATAGLVQGRVEPPPGVRVGPFDRTLWVTGPVGLFESANLFVRREVFESLGGFDDGLLDVAGAHFGEDISFGWRARRAGVATGFCDRALVHHAVFERGPGEYLHERRRLAYFCEMARRVPELRGSFFYRRWFLSRRTAIFACATAGLLASALSRRPALALAAVPYARLANADRRGVGAGAAAVVVVGDAVGLAALVRGSLRFRTLVL